MGHGLLGDSCAASSPGSGFHPLRQRLQGGREAEPWPFHSLECHSSRRFRVCILAVDPLPTTHTHTHTHTSGKSRERRLLCWRSSQRLAEASDASRPSGTAAPLLTLRLLGHSQRQGRRLSAAAGSPGPLGQGSSCFPALGFHHLSGCHQTSEDSEWLFLLFSKSI